MTIAYDKVALLLQVAQAVAGYPALKPIGDATMLELAAVADEAQKLVVKAAADKKAAEEKAATDQAAKDKAEADKTAKAAAKPEPKPFVPSPLTSLQPGPGDA